MTASETELPKYLPDVYGRIALNELVTYSVYYLAQKEAK